MTSSSVLPAPSRRVPLWWWPAALLAIGVAGYSLRYVIVGEQAFVPELAQSFRERLIPLTVHTLFGPIALVLGLVNLLPALRKRRWALHRLIGRIYLIAGLVLGAAGASCELEQPEGVRALDGLHVAELAEAVAGELTNRLEHPEAVAAVARFASPE